MPRLAHVSIAALLFFLSGCSSSQKSVPPVVESAAEVFATFPASAGRSFGLAPGKCAEGKCAAVVQLLSGGNVVDSSPLDFAASDAEFKKGVADAIMGAGDPLQETDPIPVWTAGKGDGAVATAARSMKLSSEETALLVDQSGGFEHIKRRHYLFVADDNKLKRVWTGEEGAGPAWSAAVLVDAADGHGQEIVDVTGFQPGGAASDAIGARRLGWDAVQKTLTERPLGSLYAIVAGNFASPQAARTASAQTCLSDYSALPARDLGVSGGPIVLAAITTRKSLAEAALGKAATCAGGLTRRVVDVNLTPRTQ
jgi:hypothetical protein